MQMSAQPFQDSRGAKNGYRNDRGGSLFAPQGLLLSLLAAVTKYDPFILVAEAR